MKVTKTNEKSILDFSEETTLEDWLLYWLDAYVKPVSKPSGYEHYRDNCVKHIIPAIGEIQLGNLTPRVLQRFFNEQARTGNLRTRGPLSTKSLRNMRAVLDVALKLATAEELMPSNPVPLTAIKSVKSRRVQIMTNDSQRVLETYLFEHFGHKEAGILLALYTGMRLGEICALRWKNYQESTGMLSVESTVRRISDIDSNPMASKTQLVFGSVKTTSSERELYMPDVVQQLLKLQRERFAKEFGREAGDEDFIIFNRCGRVMDPDNLSHYFSRILRQLHLEHVKFHAMRHTFATRAIENGIDVATVSGLLGHADVTTTTHFYVHPRDEAMRAAMRGIVPVGTAKFGNGA